MTNYLNINGDVRDDSSLTVPTDRTFREAWSFNEAVVEIDMTAAKVIHKDNLRAERAPRLAALDVAYMKASLYYILNWVSMSLMAYKRSDMAYIWLSDLLIMMPA